MKKIILFTFIFLAMMHLKAQGIKGNIYNASTKIPLENVMVTDQNTGERTLSNGEGFFSLKNSSFPAKLEFRILGFKNKLLTISEEEPVSVFIEEDVSMLSEVVVRSANIPLNIRKTPAAVSLISSEDLERSDNFNLVQSLNFVPGVYVNQGALNTNKINIRGIGSRAQYSTNRIKAYINGIPLTTAEGELTIDDFDPEFLERIEVVKGPVSSLYGAGLGGSIKYVYEKRRGK